MTAANGRRTVVVLLLIALGALGLRVAYTIDRASAPDPFYDWVYYRGQAAALADGRGFTDPGLPPLQQPDPNRPSADHPPLYSVLLAPVSAISGDDNLTLRLFNAVLGSLGVFLIGLLGLEIGRARSGIVAASIAALYPGLWVHDALLMSESLTVVIVTASVLLAIRAVKHPSMLSAVGLGVLCALGALARSELVLLFPLLCLPALWGAAGDSAQRWRRWGASLLAFALLLGPWVGYNLSRFERPVLVSTNFDINLYASSCPEVLSGPNIGSLGFFCSYLHAVPGRDASEAAAVYRRRAIDAIRAHAADYPLVVAARIGRVWSVFRPSHDLAVGQAEGRPRWITTVAMYWYYPLLLTAVVGAWLRRRRRAILWPLLVTPAIVTVSMVVSYGQARYRIAAEPMIVVLAADALCVLVARRRPSPSTGDAPAVAAGIP